VHNGDHDADQESEQHDIDAKFSEENSKHRDDSHCDENPASKAVSLVPDSVAGQSPWCTDADEKIPLGFHHHQPGEDENQSHGRQHRLADSEVLITKIPKYCQKVHVEQESHDHCDESIERLAKFSDVDLQRINAWYQPE